jgi:hypothetical protein
MTLVVLLVVWLVLSPLTALAFGAFIKAGHGPRLVEPLRAVPGGTDVSPVDHGPRAVPAGLEDLAA